MWIPVEQLQLQDLCSISVLKKKKLINILILNLMIKSNYFRIDIVGLKKGLGYIL